MVGLTVLLGVSCGPKNLPSGTETAGGEQQLDAVALFWTCELGYQAAFDEFVPTAPNPVPPEQVDGTAHAWGTPADFETLSCAPDGDVTGSYWIDVHADGSGGTIHSVDWVRGARVHCTQGFTTEVRKDPVTCVIH